MEFLDLFSGIGGFRRGLERSGHRCIGHVELDKYANKSYMAMYELWPCKYEQEGERNCSRICKREVREDCDGERCKGEWFAKDIEQLTAGEIPKAEIWTFGFPCTDISLAGKRKGLAGKRSGLFFTVVSLLKSTADENKPRRIIVENVKHLLSSQRGGDFATLLSCLWEAGYDLEWQCVNSKDFGVPQNRERVYLVGYFGGRSGGKVFPLSGANEAALKEVIGGHQGERVYDARGLSATLTAEGGGRGGKTGLYLCETKKPTEWMECLRETYSESCGAVHYAGFLTQKKEPDMTRIARCLVSHYYAGITRFGESSGVMECQACKETCRQRAKEEVCPYASGLPIRVATKKGYVLARHGDGINLSYPNSMLSRGRVGKQCAQTLLTEGNMGVLVYCRIRRLTPKECFRL